jgi:hypothetical protein
MKYKTHRRIAYIGNSLNNHALKTANYGGIVGTEFTGVVEELA